VNDRLRVLAVVGTRPEVIKMFAPVRAMLARADEFEVFLCSSGQHSELLRDALDTFGLTVDEDLASMRHDQHPGDIVWTIGRWVSDLIRRRQPDVVLVQGDTATAMAAGLAGYYSSIPVAHVEAGLRTYDNHAPWPEEGTRRMLDSISDLHFAPTQLSAANLAREGIASSSIHVTGNTCIDALRWAISRADRAHPAELSPSRQRRVLVTCHRRESIPDGIEAIARAVRELARSNPDVRFQFVLHPSPAVQRAVFDQLADAAAENIDLLPACDYVTFVTMLSEAYLILTDSGGVQEEATALGAPLLVVNPRTARQEGLTVGTAAIVGTDVTDIVVAAQRLLDDLALRAEMATPDDAYGDGMAGERIAAILATTIRGDRERETEPGFLNDPRAPQQTPRNREATGDSDGVLV
jgi:UDP-N-acetylglucosamine 2-epimerase (non-hydrolysing)